MIPPSIDLAEGETLVVAEHEVLFRQLTRHLISADGLPASHAFGPGNSDRGRASYSRSSVVTAQQARDWHCAVASSPSLAVWGVTVGEVVEQGRPVVDDSAAPAVSDQNRAPGHCFVDFNGLTKHEIKDVRTELYWRALERGEIATTHPDAEGTSQEDRDLNSDA
jgi:hypothetical protein